MKNPLPYIALILLSLVAMAGMVPVKKIDPVDLAYVKEQVLDPSSPYY
ncbi:MAG: hypothetical protein HDT01_00580, partial [Bacteroidales bacterium]|nr:hypothetical protein [Bacteroidales bacterium]